MDEHPHLPPENKEEAEALVQEFESVYAAAKACGMARSTFQARLNGAKPSRRKPLAPPANRSVSTLHVQEDNEAGLEGFRELFDVESKQRRRDARVQEQIEKFVKGPLKKRGWYYDQEAARVAGVPPTDWARHRDQWAHLHVTVRTESGTRKIVWCDPEQVEQYREVAES